MRENKNGKIKNAPAGIFTLVYAAKKRFEPRPQPFRVSPQGRVLSRLDYGGRQKSNKAQFLKRLILPYECQETYGL